MAKHPGIKPVQPGRNIALLVYSIPGAGKTRLVGTGGEGTLLIRPPTDHTDSIRTPGVEEWIVHGWEEMTEVHDYLRHDGEKHKWVWLDSISLFQDTGLDEIWADVIADKPHRAQYGIDKGEYGRNMDRLGRWVRHTVALAKDHGMFNFGITAHPFYGQTVDGESLLMPYVQGKNMAEKVCGYMNVVAYLDLVRSDDDGKVTRRVLRTQATDNYYAKDQFDAFEGGRMVNPTIPKIEAAIAAARGKPKVRPAKRRTTTKRRTR